MSALTNLPEFCRRVKDAALRGYQVALGDYYAAELSAEAGVTGYSGSAADLVVLAEAVLAKRTGAAPDIADRETPQINEAPQAGVADPEPSSTVDAESYDSWTKDDLYAEAQRRNLEGRSGLSKAKLIELLTADDTGEPTPPEQEEAPSES